MTLFEVIFWGRITESGYDPDAEDTIYLFRAPDFQTAIDFISRNCTSPITRYAPHIVPDRVHELGVESSDNDEVEILRGPFFECAYNRGKWKAWCRENEYDPESPWIEDSERRYDR